MLSIRQLLSLKMKDNYCLYVYNIPHAINVSKNERLAFDSGRLCKRVYILWLVRNMIVVAFCSLNFMHMDHELIGNFECFW